MSTTGALGLLVSRLVFGLSMAIAHGVGKVPPSEKFINKVDALGFPSPELFAWGAGLSELIGGCLIAAGLLTRLSSLFLLSTMIVAVFVAHAGDPFAKQELGLLYGAFSLLLILTGPGKFSLDNLVFNRKGD